jgi:hypothetical protein
MGPFAVAGKVIGYVMPLVMLASSACIPLNTKETENYARVKNLPEPVVIALNALNYDDNTRRLIDGISNLTPGRQRDPSVVNYITDIAKDRQVSRDELTRIEVAQDLSKNGLHDGVSYILGNTNPNLKKAYDYLPTVSDKAMKNIGLFGIDDNVTDYITFISTLSDRAFVKYALESRLGIEDRQLTDLEKKFLQDPNKYLSDIYDYERGQISKADSELAEKLAQLPYLKDKTLQTVESLDDLAGLLADAKYRSMLEKIYGKGIKSAMQRIALERMLYRESKGNLDMKEAFDDSAEWYVNSNLADFQAKYNTEMDQPGVTGPKPAIRGTETFHEPLQYWVKKDNEIKLDYALVRWALRCNSVKLWGCDEQRWEPKGHIFNHIKAAQNEGLDVWVTFFPGLHPFPDLDLEIYNQWLSDFSKKSQELGIKGLWVGAELDLFWKKWKGYNGRPIESLSSDERLALSKYIDRLAKSVRQNFYGTISYAEANWWEPVYAYNTNWNNMDFISFDMTIGDYVGRKVTDDFYISSLRNAKQKYSKPIFAAELPVLTISEAESAGGDTTYPLRFQVHYDPEKQAKITEWQLRMLYQVPVDGIFAGIWDEPYGYYGNKDVNNQTYDANKLGAGIWDYIAKEPKLSFWTVYKYYK